MEASKEITHDWCMDHMEWHYMGLVATKPVVGVSDKVTFKSVPSATETS